MHTNRSSGNEESRLDDAIRRADDLLLCSLHQDEQVAKRKKLRIGILTGGTLIFAAAMITSLAVLAERPASRAAASSPVTAPAATTRPADPKRARALASQGWALWQERRLVDAEAKFQAAVELDSSLTMAWNGLGWSQLNMGRRDDAEDAFNHVLELDPNHAAALNGLGWIHFGQGDYAPAEQYWLKAAPSASASWTGLAKMYLLQGKYDDAAKWSQKLIDAGDKSAQPLLDAAEAKKLSPELRKQIDPATRPA